MREGYSKVRNEALTMAFSYMHLIERWGTGMLRVAKMIKEAGLCELEILGGETELRFNIYRKQAVGKTTEIEEKSGQSVGQVPEVEVRAGQDAGQVPEIEVRSGQDTGRISEMGQNAGQILATEEKSLLDILLSNPEINVREIAQKLGMSKSAVSRLMQKLKDKKIIERVGSSQKGYWKVTIGEKANG
ncbi:MarR family transcriptional regulator [Phascolarctobacterium sp.]|uniref:MarR family transcriptional regulator n=1 Tax=Phascolarctobacterium sp. TaxID=2049039 RepID=UPI003F7E53CC